MEICISNFADVDSVSEPSFRNLLNFSVMMMKMMMMMVMMMMVMMMMMMVMMM